MSQFKLSDQINKPKMIRLREAFELKNFTKSGKSPPGGGQQKISKSPKFKIVQLGLGLS